MSNVKSIILCGGSGTRLWPLSRDGYPKQFLSLTSRETLFQQAARRTLGLKKINEKLANPILVIADEHRFIALEQLQNIGIEIDRALLEPTGRNTAPALTLAALYACSDNDDPILVVTSADQIITDEKKYIEAIEIGIKEAENGTVVILGVEPSNEEIGYGYIQVLEKERNKENKYEVIKFHEKPDMENVKKYIEEGYYWNSGIFILKASIWKKLLERYRPDILDSTIKTWENRKIDGKFIRLLKEDFEMVPSESIDYAVIEKCPDSEIPIKMVKLTAGWSDLGSWEAVWNTADKDKNGNNIEGDVVVEKTKNSLVRSTNRLVSIVGVDGLVVIETSDAVLIANKNETQEIKKIVGQLKHNKREEIINHRKVQRPWGSYDCIDEGQQFKVKRIQVKPKGILSLQKHYQRAEHWIVVAGTAEITIDNKKLLLNKNDYTYIPLGAIHRLYNPGNELLELIEIQIGAYLKEDDIVRIDDEYGRVNNEKN